MVDDNTIVTVPQIPDLSKVSGDMSTIANIGTLIGDVFSKLTSSISNLGKTIDGIVSKFGNLSNAQSAITGEMNKQSIAAAGISQMVLGVGRSFEGLETKTKSIQSISEQFMQVQTTGKFAGDTLLKVANAFQMQGVVREAGESVFGFVQRAAQGADQFQKLKNSYLGVQGASGGLAATWNKSGNTLDGLNNVIKQQSLYLNDIGKATGNSTSEIANYWGQLATAIPGAADTQITAVDGSNKSVTGLVAAMRLASGAGQDFASVTNNLTTAWSAYGLEGKDALAFTAQIYEANDKLGLKLGTTQKFINDNVNSFRGITDHGNNAINVLNNMYEAFRKTGLSADESTTIISKMTTGIKELTIGQKALLSAQSGGPGGLRGAIQIEQQIRSGDIEGVLRKAESALKKQFGGRVVTQEEAAQSDVAAATFVKQREMLKSGVFGIKAADDNQATRILEAFRNGTSATVALKDKQSSLNEIMNRGEKLQSEGNTILNSIARNTEGLQLLNNATMFEANQQYLGASERTGRPEFASENARLLRAAQENSLSRASDQARRENIGKTLGSMDAKKSDLPIQTVSEVSIRNRYLNDMEMLFKNFLPKIGNLSKSDQVKADAIQVKLTSADTKIQEAGKKELQELATSISKEKESKIRTGSSLSDIQSITEREQVFGSLSRFVANQNVGRGTQVGVAAVGSARAQGPTGTAPNQTNITRMPNQEGVDHRHTTEHKFDVTFRGLCVNCATPIQPDAHSQARTDGAHGTK